MSVKYPGGFITKTQILPTTSAASGVWTLDQAMQYTKAGTWPLPGAWVDDVFSSYTYTGNGSTQTITNGIDLAGKGGLVWIKDRGAPNGHILQDTVRGTGANCVLQTDTTGAQVAKAFPSFGSTGFSLNFTEANSIFVNTNNSSYVSWTFRKAPKFFDVVTYTGNATNNRTVSHSLGQTPGMIIVKRTDSAGSWWVWHRGFNSGNGYGELNATGQFGVAGSFLWGDGSTYVAPTSSVFTISSAAEVNTNAGTYVAYLFAHDTATDGIIQCGSYTGIGASNLNVNLGWEPQYVLIKQASPNPTNWMIVDNMRGYGEGALFANLSNAEQVFFNNLPLDNGSNRFVFTSTGFGHCGGNGTIGTSGSTYIYLAIRRPNKPPTTGTQVYNAIARTGTDAAATVTGVGFAPDVLIVGERTSSYAKGGPSWFDRLRGATSSGANSALYSSSTTAETLLNPDAMNGLTMNGVNYGADASNAFVNFNTNETYINWFFKRAPGVFDEVCYTGTGSATTVAHNLGVAPELMIVKSRSSAAYAWYVTGDAFAVTEDIVLNSTAAKLTNAANRWNSTRPTSSVFSIGTGAQTNTVNETYVWYGFATKAGISKVGSYTGNGSSQTIDCGFTTGARFVLIKRTDSTGDWYTWDSTRGIVAGNDPHLSLNTTSAEVTTDDTIDPDTSGFIVNQLAATNINVTSATYIYLSFA